MRNLLLGSIEEVGCSANQKTNKQKLRGIKRLVEIKVLFVDPGAVQIFTSIWIPL